MYGCRAGKQKKSAGYNSDIQTFFIYVVWVASVAVYGSSVHSAATSPHSPLLRSRHSFLPHRRHGSDCSGGGGAGSFPVYWRTSAVNNFITSVITLLLLLLYGCIIDFRQKSPGRIQRVNDDYNNCGGTFNNNHRTIYYCYTCTCSVVQDRCGFTRRTWRFPSPVILLCRLCHIVIIPSHTLNNIAKSMFCAILVRTVR